MTELREIALLLDGTSLTPDAGRIARMQEQIERGIEWSELLRIAIPHGVLPLLGKNLITHAASLLPAETLVQLERFNKRVAERNWDQSLELVKLISALSRDGFRALPFKGPVLAETFYGDAGLRESHDLDLLIDPTQFNLVMHWFRDAGYRPVRHVLGVAQELPSHQAIQEEFWNPEGTVLVEIKAHIELSKASVFDPPFEQIWERRDHIRFCGSELAVIAAEDLLPGLAVHGSKHFWRRLNWIVDIAAVVSSRPEPDWDRVLGHATEWRCRRRLLVAVALAGALYETEIPAALIQQVKLPAVRSAVAHICASLFEQKLHTFRGLRSEVAYSLRTSDSLSERLRYLKSSGRFINRVLQADEGNMMLPMSGGMRRVYSGFAAVREWVGVKTKAQ